MLRHRSLRHARGGWEHESPNGQTQVSQRIVVLRVALKVASMLLASIVLMPVQWILMRFTRGRIAFLLPLLWFRCLRRALGIKVEIVGMPRRMGGTVFVGNHLSHYDIVVLGSVLRARFIAKDDMERWPGMRFIGKLGQTLFISRRRTDAAAVTAALAAQIRADEDLVLFAEGTTSSGEHVAPFKSSLFSLFQLKQRTGIVWTMQPFTLEIVSVDRCSLSSGGHRDSYAY